MRVAVVELGSGSTKLLITGGETGATELSAEIKTNLSMGLATEGALGPASLQATATALAQFRKQIDAEQVDTLVAVGTGACRRASNAEQLDRIVTTELGVELTILSAEREAELAMSGALAGRNLDLPVVVVDVGTGSTEFGFTDHEGATFGSIPLGARDVCEQFINSDPPLPEELSAALSVIELHLDDIRRTMPGVGASIAGGCTVVAPGAMTEVAAVELGLLEERSVDGEVQHCDGVEEVFRAVATESRDDRAHNPGLKSEHLDDIVGALCILVEFIRQFGVEEIVVSEQGLRRGLANAVLRGE